MSENANLILSILSFCLALISLVFVYLTLKQNTKILQQSQKQFDESKRLEYQPFLQMELIKKWTGDIADYYIEIPIEKDPSSQRVSLYSVSLCKIKNVGNGTANNLIYTWKSEEPPASDTVPFPINAVMSGDEYLFKVGLRRKTVGKPDRIEFEWAFEDILGNSYEQKSILNYDYQEIDSIDNDPPILEIIEEKRLKKTPFNKS